MNIDGQSFETDRDDESVRPFSINVEEAPVALHPLLTLFGNDEGSRLSRHSRGIRGRDRTAAATAATRPSWRA